MSTTDLGSHIAGEIRAGAARKQMTLEELAAAAGISPATFWRRMSGQTPFNVPELHAISQTLGLAFASLFPAEEAS